MPEVNDLFQLIKTAQNILILIKGKLSLSDINELSNLSLYLKSIKKAFQILSLEKQEDEINTYASKKEIEITTELKPAEYVVTIDYGTTGVEKVVYDTDKEQGKLVFKILPSKAGFNFDKIEFSEGGGKFDATITVGVNNPMELKSFYDENEYLFKENAVYKFEKFSDVTKALANSSEALEKDVVDSILVNQLQGINLLEGKPETNELENLFALVDMGGDLPSAIHSKYYSKSENYLKTLRNILKNVSISDNVIFSVLRKEDINETSLEEVLNIGRLPFNYMSKYNLAMLFVENIDGLVHLIVESNDTQKYNAQTLAGVFGGRGDAGHSVTQLDGIHINEIDKRFSPVLKDLYNINLKVQSGGVDVDNFPKVLTKPRRNSKNKGLQNSK